MTEENQLQSERHREIEEIARWLRARDKALGEEHARQQEQEAAQAGLTLTEWYWGRAEFELQRREATLEPPRRRKQRTDRVITLLLAIVAAGLAIFLAFHIRDTPSDDGGTGEILLTPDRPGSASAQPSGNR